MSTRDLINAIAAGDAIEIENAFNSVMAEKVSVRIDDMRYDVAHNLFAEQTEEIEEEAEELDEISIQTMKSAKEKLGSKAIEAHYDDNKVAARNYASRALKIGSKINKKEWQQTNQKRLDQTKQYRKEELEGFSSEE